MHVYCMCYIYVYITTTHPPIHSQIILMSCCSLFVYLEQLNILEHHPHCTDMSVHDATVQYSWVRHWFLHIFLWRRHHMSHEQFCKCVALIASDRDSVSRKTVLNEWLIVNTNSPPSDSSDR